MYQRTANNLPGLDSFRLGPVTYKLPYEDKQFIV